MTAVEASPFAWTPEPFVGTPRPVRITDAQLRVLESLCQGHSTRMIMRDWGIAEDTVKTHVRRLLAATGARDRVHLLALVLGNQVRVRVAPPHAAGIVHTQSGRALTGTLGHARRYPPAS